MNNKVDWSKFTVSCSAISKIMSYPKGSNDLTAAQKVKYFAILEKEKHTPKEKELILFFEAKLAKFNNPELSASAIKYLMSRYSWEKYNKGTLPTNETASSVIKGRQLEPDAIKVIEKRDKYTYQRGDKCEYGELLFGMCEMYCKDKGKAIDVKVSWGIYGFLPHLINKLSAKYWMQMQGYLELYGIDKGEVSFVLLNTPQALIDKEKNKYTEKFMTGEINNEKFEEVMENLDLLYDYNKIPKKRRVISFDVVRDKDFISKVAQKIEKCRKWLIAFDKIHTKNKRIVTSYLDYKYAKTDEDNSESDTADPC